MNIYTKTGDAGETSLNGGTRVSKTDSRVDAYGAVDELNAHVGYIAAFLDQNTDDTLIDWLHMVQHQLFAIGSHLATPQDSPAREHLPSLEHQSVTQLEEQIDAMTDELPELTHFILPGGIAAAAQAHVTRTVCRRAERVTVTIENADPIILQYLNRLSDWLFTLARLINHRNDTSEIEWNA